MPKNVKTTVQLRSFLMLVRLCSKSFMLSFSSMWTKNFQMYSGFIKDKGNRDQIANNHWIIEKQKNSRKILLLLHWLGESLWLCGLPWWFRQWRVCLQCRRPGFDPWVGKNPWRRKLQPTPILLPGKSHGWRSLAGYSPWSHKESDTTEQVPFAFT